MEVFKWTRPCEKSSAPLLYASRTFIYPMDMAEMMEMIRSGHQNLLPVQLEEVGRTISALRGGWARQIELKLLSYE
jgi:hypothetical protein